MQLWEVGDASMLYLTEIVRMEEKDVVVTNQGDEDVQVERDDRGKYTFELSGTFSFVLYRYRGEA
ncbi:hypothetical protein D3C85_1875490 [compost metagenome]